jgi:hypothetical protein
VCCQTAAPLCCIIVSSHSFVCGLKMDMLACIVVCRVQSCTAAGHFGLA